MKNTTIESGQAEMTWEQIGLQLGFKRSAAKRNAFMIYKRAIKKIRNRPESIKALRELVEFRNSQRPAGYTFPDLDGE
jgi:hypothetical protein